MKLLIAEDDAFVRIMIKKFLKGTGHTLVETVNGEDAFTKMIDEEFDAVIIDWMMPKLDGLELIKTIRKNLSPVPFLMMISAIGSDEAKKRALDAGADAYLTKPFEKELFLETLENGVIVNQQGRRSISIINRGTPSRSRSLTGVGVASSTGGPQTLLKVFADIAYSERSVFFLVQHGPVWMLTSFVERLQNVTPMKVQLGVDRMKYHPGNIYLAPGDLHMIVDPVNEELRLIDDPPENYCKPAADPLFRSIASAFGTSSMSIVLSGMGRDGTIGSGYIKAAGGTVIAQDPATAILPSMPQSVTELMIASKIIPLENLGAEVSKLLNGSMATARSGREMTAVPQ